MRTLGDFVDKYKSTAMTAIIAFLCTGSVGAGIGMVKTSNANPIYVSQKVDSLGVRFKKEIDTVKNKVDTLERSFDSLTISVLDLKDDFKEYEEESKKDQNRLEDKVDAIMIHMNINQNAKRSK